MEGIVFKSLQLLKEFIFEHFISNMLLQKITIYRYVLKSKYNLTLTLFIIDYADALM